MECSRRFVEYSIASSITFLFLVLFIILFSTINSLENNLKDLNEAVERKENYSSTTSVQHDLQDQQAGCTDVGGRCFTFNLNLKYTQSDSEDFCKLQGGKLAEFDDFSVTLQIGLLPQIRQKIKDNAKLNFWLNGKDDINEGTWKWGSGKPLLSTNPHWIKGEPNDAGGYEDCVMLTYKQNSHGFNDVPCDDNQISFICEF